MKSLRDLKYHGYFWPLFWPILRSYQKLSLGVDRLFVTPEPEAEKNSNRLYENLYGRESRKLPNRPRQAVSVRKLAVFQRFVFEVSW
jgi:hypothetical protein